VPLNASQRQNAQLIYSTARSRGLSPQRSLELVNAAYAESGLNAGARNRSSGAGGLFQLLSSGYVSKANRMGGVNNPRANLAAILPNYISYWRSHPNARPGEAARDVERSGEGAGFYSGALGMLSGAVGNVPAGRPLPVPQTGGASTSPVTSSGVNPRAALASALIAANQASSRNQTPDYSQLASLVAQARMPTPAPTASTPVPVTQGHSLAISGPTQGVKPKLLSAVSAAAREMGATKIRITSGYRPPAVNAAAGGVAHSNHLTGDAIDGEAYVPGQGWVPVGRLVKPVAHKYGLRSGDQSGFYHGGRDPVHVDDAANQR
jgi:hypothetical protein